MNYENVAAFTEFVSYRDDNPGGKRECTEGRKRGFHVETHLFYVF